MTARLHEAISSFHSYLRRRQLGEKPIGGKLAMQSIAEAVVGLLPGTLPVDPEDAAALLGARVEMSPASARGQLGSLIPALGGFRVILYGQHLAASQDPDELVDSPKPDRVLSSRGRFTLAHELGHTFFYSGTRANTPQRITPKGALRNEHWWEEGLCHDFARALLMPDVGRRLVEHHASPHAVVRGAKTFRVSREVFLRRVLHDWQLWSDSTWLHASWFQGTVRTQVLHGSSRRNRRRTPAEATRFQSALNGTFPPEGVVRVVATQLGLKQERMLVSSHELWALLL